MADDGSTDSNLYQYLDFTKLEPNNQKNENRHFKWLSKFRRSKNQKPVHSEPASYQPEEQQYDSPKPINYDDYNSSPAHNPSFAKAAFKIAPFRLKKLSKKSKESAHIILPPLPSINQAASHGSYNPGNYGSKEDSFIFQPGQPYRQTYPTTASPSVNTQPAHPQEEPTYSALELAFNAPKPSSKERTPVQPSSAEFSYSPLQIPSNINSPTNSPVVSNPGNEHDADTVPPPTHNSDSRYSKWFSKLRRRKSNQNHPEKPQHEPLKVHDQPSFTSQDASGIPDKTPEPIYYYQNSSPYNPSQPGATQHQPGNDQSFPFSRNPQIANSSPQVAPTRPTNTKQHSAPPPSHSETLNAPLQPINYNSQDNLSTEELENPPAPSGNFYSKFMKKIKRNKTQKPEPVTVVSQPQPIFSPLQTAYNNPPSDPSVYRHPQTSPQSSPPLKPTNIIKPQPTASPAPHHSLHHQSSPPFTNQPPIAHPEAPTPYSPLNNSPVRPHVAPVQKPIHPLHQESDTFFPPPNRPDFGSTPFQKQSEKVQGNNEHPDGFFEFGIFPSSNGFFDQNFKG